VQCGLALQTGFIAMIHILCGVWTCRSKHY